MIKQLKRLAGDSLIYGLSGIISRMIGIFLVPIYTNLFLPKDYGIINLTNTTFFLISLLVVCALDNAVARWFYDSTDTEDHKKTFGSWIWFQFSLSITIAVLICIFSVPLTTFFFGIDGKPIYFILSSVALIANILPSVISNWYRVHRRPVATVVFSLAQALTSIGLTIFFVLVLKWHLTGVFASLALTSIIFSIVAIQQMYGWLHFNFFNKGRLGAMLKFSLPMIPAALGYWILNSADSYLLAFFKNKTEVGLFGIGAALGSCMSLFTGSFQQAWGPFAFSIMNEDNARQVYANVFLLYSYFMSFLAAMVLLFAPEVLLLLTSPKYYGAAWVAGILSYNLVLIGFTYIAVIGVSIAKITSPYAIGMLFATIVTILLDILLIPYFGKEGSAIATLIAQLIVPCYLFYRSQKVYPIPYRFKESIIIFLSMGTIVVGVRSITFPTIPMQVVAKVIVALIMFIVTILFNRKLMNSFWNKFKNKRLQNI